MFTFNINEETFKGVNKMKTIKELLDKYKGNGIQFVDDIFWSTDQKTIMGETTFGSILFLPYRNTNIGSNPREYTGLKKSNVSIFRSVVNHYDYLFRFLHSGVIVCITSPQKTDNAIIYEDCCLTNGNQTRYVLLSLILIKLIIGNELRDFNKKDFDNILKEINDNPEVKEIILKIKNKINLMVTEIKKDEELFTKYRNIDINDLLNSKIRIQVNVISSIANEALTSDEYSIGTKIAEANNDTQKVREDDIFSNRYQHDLKSKIFNNFTDTYKNVTVEYKFGEVEKGKEKVHILTLLRPIIATGLICNDKDIFKLTNQRQPVYSLFTKIIKASKNKTKTITIISKLIPLLYEIRIKYVIPLLEQIQETKYREYLEKASSGELDETAIGKQIKSAKGSKEIIEKIIKNVTNYNIEHIFPVVVYTIRKTIYDNSGKIDIGIPYENRKKAFTSIIEAIYSKYVKMKIEGLPTSLTTVVREKELYEFGIDAYNTAKQFCSIDESSYISENRNIFKASKNRK